MAANETYAWRFEGHEFVIGVDRQGPPGAPPLLLLPALSTVSTRAEMAPLAGHLAGHFRTIAPDWPGFGDNPRPARDYTPALLRRFLEDFLVHLRTQGDARPAVAAAGHAGAYALDLEARRPGSYRRLILIAPTWRGPLPTAMGGRRPVQAHVRRMVQAPLIGPLLYRLNTIAPVVRRMLQGHVLADPAHLTPELLAAKMRIVRQPNARFASAAFVTGGLDPMQDRAAFLDAAGSCRAPILLVYGGDVPRRSRGEMEALAALPNVETEVLARGALGMHEEMAAEISGHLMRYPVEEEVPQAAAPARSG